MVVDQLETRSIYVCLELYRLARWLDHHSVLLNNFSFVNCNPFSYLVYFFDLWCHEFTLDPKVFTSRKCGLILCILNQHLVNFGTRSLSLSLSITLRFRRQACDQTALWDHSSKNGRHSDGHSKTHFVILMSYLILSPSMKTALVAATWSHFWREGTMWEQRWGLKHDLLSLGCM